MLSSVVSPHQLKRSYLVNLRLWGCGYFVHNFEKRKLRSTSREIFWLICTRNWSRLQPLIVTAPRQDYINFKKDLKQKQKGGSGRVYQRQKYFNITWGVGRVRQSNSKPSLAGLAEAEGKGFAVCNEELLHTSQSHHLPILLFSQGTYLTVCHYRQVVRVTAGGEIYRVLWQSILILFDLVRSRPPCVFADCA